MNDSGSALLDSDALRAAIRARTGATLVTHLGVVHEGRMGYAACRAELGIDQRQGLYELWIAITQRKNRAGRHTRVVKWPYSRLSATDLAGVIADWRVVEELPTGLHALPRGNGLSRIIDRLIGRQPLGEHRFTSVLSTGRRRATTVSAQVVRMRGALEVTLIERRRGGTPIIAQFPHAACTGIRRALADHAAMAR